MRTEFREVRGAPVKATCAYCGGPTLGIETSEVVAVELVWQHVQAEHKRFTDRGSAAISLTAMPSDRAGIVTYSDVESHENAVHVRRPVGSVSSS